MDSPNGTVYIVEDNDSFRKSLVRLVRTFGYRTEAFESASDLLSSTTCEHPGCILLDVRLPDIDGFQLQSQLQQKGCNLPIVFMSGHRDLPTRIDGIKQEEVEFLAKPFAPEVLQATIHQAMVRNQI